MNEQGYKVCPNGYVFNQYVNEKYNEDGKYLRIVQLYENKQRCSGCQFKEKCLKGRKGYKTVSRDVVLNEFCYEMTIVKWKYHIPLIFVFFQSRTQDKKLLYRFIGVWPLCYSWIGYLRSMVSPQVSLSMVVNQIFGIRSVYIGFS